MPKEEFNDLVTEYFRKINEKEDSTLEATRLFIEQEGTPNPKYKNFTLLQLAIETGRKKSAEFLIRNGADINSNETENGLTLLMIAVLGDKFQHIKFLIENGANVSAKSGDDRDTLLIAAEENRPEILNAIIVQALLAQINNGVDWQNLIRPTNHLTRAEVINLLSPETLTILAATLDNSQLRNHILSRIDAYNTEHPDFPIIMEEATRLSVTSDEFKKLSRIVLLHQRYLSEVKEEAEDSAFESITEKFARLLNNLEERHATVARYDSLIRALNSLDLNEAIETEQAAEDKKDKKRTLRAEEESLPKIPKRNESSSLKTKKPPERLSEEEENLAKTIREIFRTRRLVDQITQEEVLILRDSIANDRVKSQDRASIDAVEILESLATRPSTSTIPNSSETLGQHHLRAAEER